MLTQNSECDIDVGVFTQSSCPHCTLVNQILFGHFAVEVQQLQFPVIMLKFSC